MPARRAAVLSAEGPALESLARSVDLDIKGTYVDDRHDYGEVRYRAYGFIDGVTYCLTFTTRNGRSAFGVRTARR